MTRDSVFVRMLPGLLLAISQETIGQTWEPVRLGDSTIEVTGHLEPLTGTVYKFEEKFTLIRNLAVAEKQRTRGHSDFQAFLPQQPVRVGEVWKVDPQLVVPILKQFHAGAQAELHHGEVSAPGGWACLSALTDKFAEISFRIHAEFLLEGDGGYETSSWLTPAQFRGRLVIDRISQQLVGFQMGVPFQSANVDMNVRMEGSSGADIGRIPRMELIGGTFPEFSKGTSRIPEKEVRGLLARKFYSFAEIEWLDLAAARAQSLKTGKPLHVIALFGSLDDESC